MRFGSLNDLVIVLTGASSGIGELAARELLLKEGAKLVLAARNINAIKKHLMDWGINAAQAIAVQTDVSNFEDIKSLAQLSVQHFGRIDIWINDAGISIYGRVDELDADEISRIVDVNLKGCIYGSKVALENFKNQGYGNLINISSALGKGSTPLQSAYTATKHGIVGFSSCLREELYNDGYKNIEVSVILPSSMDTPLFAHARSKEGRQPYPIPPVYAPMVTVKEIIRCAKNPVPEVVAGMGGKLMVFGYRFFPNLLEKYMGRTGVKSQFLDKAKSSEDNLFSPMPVESYQIRGGFGSTQEHLIQEVKGHPIRTGFLMTVPLFAIGWLLMRPRPALPAPLK